MFTRENDGTGDATEASDEIVHEDPLQAVCIVLGGLVLAFLTHLLWENRLINVFAALLPLYAVVAQAITTRLIIAGPSNNAVESDLIRASLRTTGIAVIACLVTLAAPDHFAWLGIFALTPIAYTVLPFYDRWKRARAEEIEASGLTEDEIEEEFLGAGERESRLSEQLIAIRGSHIRHEVAARMGLAEFEARSF